MFKSIQVCMDTGITIQTTTHGPDWTYISVPTISLTSHDLSPRAHLHPGDINSGRIMLMSFRYWEVSPSPQEYDAARFSKRPHRIFHS
jgi:hypothetical protein